MARFVDADELLNRLPDDLPYKGSVKRVLMQAPTADVAPKSEVDKWKSISEQIHKEMSERVVEERKIERNLAVAQIIGEILSRHTPDCDGFLTMHTSELPEIKKKHTEGKTDGKS